VGAITSLPVTQKILPLIPGKLKRLTKVLLANWQEAPAGNAWSLPSATACATTEELSLLQQCQWRLPLLKAQTVLGYQPEVGFDEAMRRSLAWLKFTGGYPVRE